MSSPIKPPGGTPPGAPPPDGVAGPRAGKPEPAEAFREVLQSDAQGPAAAQEAGPAAGPRAIAEDLRAGRIDAATAIDRLVTHTLGSPMAQALAPAQRADLEADLRRALTEDPTLLALTKDLERGT